jgi:beta-aspartyl-peptidase (threonine type)
MIRFALHGGAGVIDRRQFTEARELCYRAELERIARVAVTSLQAGEKALDVVEQAVSALEDCPFFNAGHGAVLNRQAQAELDAAIMCGRARSAGAVGAVLRVRNPVRAARAVMEQGEHVMLVGPAADDFARNQQVVMVDPAYFVLPERLQQLAMARAENRVTLDHDEKYGVVFDPQDKKGTVGAVALDHHGDLAAATSTGGMTNKVPGRLGDAPIIGAGTWADNETCAVSATGHGEFFIRCVVAYDVHARMLYGQQSLQTAAEAVLARVRAMGGTGGLIAISKAGKVILPFNAPGMYRAWFDGAELRTGVY